MFQETIKTTQIGRLDGNVRRRRQLGTRAGQGDHGLGRQWLILSQQTTQRVVHCRLAVAGGMVQNPQVRAACDLGSVFVLQPVVGHAKAAVGEQVRAITIVVKGTRLAHQLVDDVPVVDRVFVASHQPRQRVHVLARVPDFHTVGIQPRFDFLADQPAVDRVGIAVDVDQAPRVHAHRQPQATVLPLRRQRPQRGAFLGVPFPAGRVAHGHHLVEKAQVVVAAAEVAAATQMQRLVHRRLEMPMRRLAVAVLVRLAHIDPFAGQAVMVQQPPIARLKLALGREVVDRRAQAIAAVPARHAPEFPQRVLQAVGQRLERLRRADAHRFPVRVREHEVIHEMVETLAEDRDGQRVHAGEIRGRQVAGVMHLAEHDRACRTRRGPPLLNATLEGAPLALGKLPGILLLEPVKQCFGMQTRLGFQPFLDLRPQLRQRVLPRPIGAWLLLGAGQRTQFAILACRLLVHASPPGRYGQPLLRLQVPKQFPYLSIRDHRKPPVCKELQLWSILRKPGILIVAGRALTAIPATPRNRREF